MNFSNKKTNKTLQKPLTQLTVNHFFTPVSNSYQTLKKSNQLPKFVKNSLGIPEKIQEDFASNEQLIEKIDEFLKINNKNAEIQRENSDICDKKPLEIINENGDKNTPYKSIEIKTNFSENSINSSNNSEIADILLNNYLKDQQEEMEKILIKPSNLFQISQTATNSSLIPSFIVDKFGENQMNFPFILLTLTHQLYCKNIDFFVLLSGKWQNLSLFPSDFIEIFGFFDKSELFLHISNETPDNYLIYEPKITLYPTLILDSHKCLRRGILSLNYLSNSSVIPSFPLIMGCLSHKIFENCFKSYKEGFLINKAFIKGIYDKTLITFIEELYLMEKNETDFTKEFSKYIDEIADFFRIYLYEKKELIFNEKTGEKLKILRVVDTESMIIWGNMGLKGQLDAIFYCQITKKAKKGEITDEISYCFIPFELKSGKEYYTHFYQVFLYSLLLSHKFDQKLRLLGFFFYLSMNKIVIKVGNSNDIIDLILRRNSLSFSIKNYEESIDENDLFLPEILRKNVFECNKCPFNEVCSSLEIAYTDKNGENSKVIIDKNGENSEEIEFEAYDRVKRLMNSEEKAYLKKWMNLLKLEENFEKGSNFSLKKTQKKGDNSKLTQKNTIKSLENQLVFSLENPEKIKEILDSLLLKNKTFNNKITLSLIKKAEPKDQESILNLYEILSMIDIAILRQIETKMAIKIHIDYKKIFQKADKLCLKVEISATFAEIMLNIDKFTELFDLLYINPQFFIEKYDKTYYPSIRTQIFSLLLDSENIVKRQLLVNNMPNTFNNEAFPIESIINSYKSFNLNEDQIETIRKALKIDHFNLILGMPGTGKTHTLVILIKILWDLGMKLLISSYTHSALDNILIKLLNLFPETKSSIVRYNKSNHLIANQQFESVIYDRGEFNSCEEINEFFQGKRLTFVTTLSSRQAILSKIIRDFINEFIREFNDKFINNLSVNLSINLIYK